MTLKIVRADEPINVETVVLTIYGAPGIGKSTLGFGARRPLLIDFDDGAKRAANRKDTVIAKQWRDITDMTAGDLADYDTIVVDTVGRALDALSLDIIERNPKMGQNGALSLQGFGQLKSQFAAWVKLLRSFGKDLVLIAHSTEDKSGDVLIERLDMQGASKNEVHKISDAMGRLAIRDRKRVLDFTPGEVTFGKNPAQLDELVVPHVETDTEFLAKVIEQIKDSLNALTAEQRERMLAIEEWAGTIRKATTDKQINAMITETQNAPENIRAAVKGQLNQHAVSRGFVYDRKAGKFAKPAPEPEPEQNAEAAEQSDPDKATEMRNAGSDLE